MPIFLRSFVLVLFAATLNGVSFAAQQNPFGSALQDSKYPPSEQVFVLDYSQVDSELRVRFAIRDGFYLYQHRFDFTPEEKVFQLRPLPEGEHTVDEFFGETVVYRDHVELVVDLNAARRNEVLNVHLQGCADEGFCYPPSQQQIFLRKTAGASSNKPAGSANSATQTPANAKTNHGPNLGWLLLLGSVAVLVFLVIRRRKS